MRVLAAVSGQGFDDRVEARTSCALCRRSVPVQAFAQSLAVSRLHRVSDFFLQRTRYAVDSAVQGKERLESIRRLWWRFRSLVSTDRAFQTRKRLFEESYLRWPSLDLIGEGFERSRQFIIESSLSRA